MIDLFDVPLTPKFLEELPEDKNSDNYPRQVNRACYSFVKTKSPTKPELVHYSTSYLEELQIRVSDKKKFLDMMSGAQSFGDFQSYAMCYGGHQFGHWAGQLGDGRAINIADLDLQGKLLQLQLKGSGPTPYSRTADGFAVLRSSIREYLCSEAMHHLGVPTTRALSLSKTGDRVPRDVMYNGNVQYEDGAVVCRTAPSFIRFGNFQIFSARQEIEELKKIVDFTIKHYFPHLGEPSKITYLAFFQEVVDKTRDMIIHWQRVGFVHGVMNTDNLSILGLTIDYGPYGWLDDYNPDWTPNTTDAQHRRYRYGNQPNIALWNLAQLANALCPLVEETEPLQVIINSYKSTYLSSYHQMMCDKLGLYLIDEISETFISNLTDQMTVCELDMTLFFRELSYQSCNDFDTFWDMLISTSYLDTKVLMSKKAVWNDWYTEYINYIQIESISPESRQLKMKAVNPKYVLRNYMAQMAIEKAEEGNFQLIDELYKLLLKPYDEQPNNQKWYAQRPNWAKDKVGCSMLSCSS